MKWKQFEPWQKKRMIITVALILVVGISYLSTTSAILFQDKWNEDEYWTSNLVMSTDKTKEANERSKDATEVTVGTYLENMKEVNIKGTYFRGVYQIWFEWYGDEDLSMAYNFHVYKGTVNSIQSLKNYHDGDHHYELIRADITVTKDYWTRRFPLESHQLRMYLESSYPIEEVVFKADKANSGYNKNLSLPGYEVRQFDVGIYANKYDSTHGDPELKEPFMSSEFVSAIEINRDGFGLYLKCFIALVGTITWVMIAMFICANHHVDPLGMIPAALFGTVTNIMVGANLLPDALQTGLLEFVNFYGIMIIIAGTIGIININRVRQKYQDKKFAKSYGHVIFVLLLFFIIVGNILLPLSAYLG